MFLSFKEVIFSPFAIVNHMNDFESSAYPFSVESLPKFLTSLPADGGYRMNARRVSVTDALCTCCRFEGLFRAELVAQMIGAVHIQSLKRLFLGVLWKSNAFGCRPRSSAAVQNWQTLGCNTRPVLLQVFNSKDVQRNNRLKKRTKSWFFNCGYASCKRFIDVSPPPPPPQQKQNRASFPWFL